MKKHVIECTHIIVIGILISILEFKKNLGNLKNYLSERNISFN